MNKLAFSALAEAAIAAYSGRDPGFARRIHFWITFFGNKDITTLTAADIEDGIDALIARGKLKTLTRPGESLLATTGEPLAPSTINRYVAALGTVFKDLRRLRLLPRGFSSPLRGVGRQPEGAGRTLSVTVEDVRRLIAACHVSRYRKLAAVTAMACTTGWRLGALQGLRWKDLDLKSGTADVERTKNGRPHRTPLLPWVIEELKRIRPAQAAGEDLVFGKRNFRKAWSNALKLADLPQDWTFHHCRHIAASILAQSGANTATIMAALNHRTPMMALRYAHLNVDALRESVGKAWS